MAKGIKHFEHATYDLPQMKQLLKRSEDRDHQ